MTAILPLEAAEAVAPENLDLPECERCGSTFSPRAGSGGRPQKFCSPKCRGDYHAANPQRETQSPTCSAPPTLESGEGRPTSRPTSDLYKPAVASRAEPDDWEWWRDPENEDCIVQRSCSDVAIYSNGRGDIVIRGEQDNDTDDVFIFISRHNLQAVIDRLEMLQQEDDQ